MINVFSLKNKWPGEDVNFSGTIISSDSLQRIIDIFSERLKLELPLLLEVGLADGRKHKLALDELRNYLTGSTDPSSEVTSIEILESTDGEGFYLWAHLQLEFDTRGRSRFSCLSKDEDGSQKDWPMGFSREIEGVRNASYPSEDILDIFKEKFRNACVLDLDGSISRELHETRSAQQRASKSKAEEKDRDAKEFKRVATKRLIEMVVTVFFVAAIILVATLLRMSFGFDVLSWVEKILTGSFGGSL